MLVIAHEASPRKEWVGLKKITQNGLCKGCEEYLKRLFESQPRGVKAVNAVQRG